MHWCRKAAENGDADSCLVLATRMYLDTPYAREVGHVVEAAGVATSAEVMEGHDIPRHVLTGVSHWLRKWGGNLSDKLKSFRRQALEGAKYCHNDGCEVVGHLKDFTKCARSARPPGTARCVPETGLDDGWAQGDVWHIRIYTQATHFHERG